MIGIVIKEPSLVGLVWSFRMKIANSDFIFFTIAKYISLIVGVELYQKSGELYSI